MIKQYFETHTLDLKGISKIELVGYGGEVSVHAGNEVPVCHTFSQGEIEFRMIKDGNKLRIFARPPLLFPKETKIRIQLHIPQNLDLKIVGESVPIKIGGSYGSVDIVGCEGDIVLEETTGNFKILSSKGDIVLRNVRGRVEASTQDGDILATNLFGEHKLQTSTGTLTLNRGEGRFKLFSKYSLSVDDILFEGESGNYIVCEGTIRISGLSSAHSCVLNIKAPLGKIRNELQGFHILQTGKNFIATALGANPSKILLQSDEEIFLDSKKARNDSPIGYDLELI